MNNGFVTIDKIKIPLAGEKNILQVARKANIEIPTFCYHSELSVYGACRLCLVDVEGKGIIASCAEPPVDGMVVRTNTAEIRDIRRMNVELLLANHDQKCPTCDRSDDCKLRELASRMGIKKVRYRATKQLLPLDESSLSLVRDPNKCVLCGDCVRFCSEVQGIGAIEFINRGEGVMVSPAFKKGLAQVDCINCGQCASVCPTGAIVPKSETERVWQAIHDEKKIVVAQVAPAVRVALGEMFGLKPGELTTGKLIAALKMMGFDKVFDTSFAADLTVMEEATEFLARKKEGKNLPIFTSCCPGWVKYAEQSFPELLPHLSTCRSPQQMFGAVAKAELPEILKIDKKCLVMVSIMPCTAKKFEARRPEFSQDGIAEVDNVLTTQELGRMIKEVGINFNNLEAESMDLPLGFTTGAGVIFGNSGGVSEAVLRYAYEAVSGKKLEKVDFQEVRGQAGIRKAKIDQNGQSLKVAIVHGLKNAKELAEKIIRGEEDVDIVEVMACPGGCIGGAGQPVPKNLETRLARTRGLYEADKNLQLHKAQENPFLKEYYATKLGSPNSHKAHELLHTHYRNRKRIESDEIALIPGTNKNRLEVKVCIGTSCYLRGSQDILAKIIHTIDSKNLADYVDVKATFCTEHCEHGPTVNVGGQVLHNTNFNQVCSLILKETASHLAE